ncbi:MAG: flippase [Dehalococcoidia bacterium]|nr:flippase [Dehalococcoidia bacterium]
MFEPLSDSLKKIAHGTGIAMVGMFLGLLFGFIARLIIARYGLEANYGIFSLALVVLTFATMLACLGLQEGATRYIAFFRGKEEATRVRGTISASLQLATVASIILCIAILFSAEAIARNIFHAPDLAPALRIFAIGIPFFALINILSAIFRGFDRVEPQAYFQSILLNILFLLFLSAVILLDLPFITVFYAYLATLVLTFIALVLYTVRKLPQPITFTTGKVDTSVRKELLFFSLPLLGTAMFTMIIFWMDTLMLGYFKVPEVVGLYNAACPLAQFISHPSAAMLLIYTPVATGLYSQNLMAELRRNYTILTKWVASLTLPIFLVLCLFPEAVLNLLFGSAYITAAPALRILSLAFIIHNLFGPRGATLIALGYPRFVMWSVLAAAIINVALNIVLIPPLGIVGAAIASAVSIILVDIILTARVYSLCRAQPLSKNLFKPLIASVVLAFLFQFIIGSFLTITLWMLPLLFILYYVIYGIATVLTRSFDREDIALLLEIEKRSGINAGPIKRILSRFV